jgi:type IV pilus assembly protein PilE
MFNRKGFTLIELLVVVLIIGILAAIALPQYQNAVEKSRAAEALILVKALKEAQDRYILTTGAPAKSFYDFDIALPAKSKPCVNSGYQTNDCILVGYYQYELGETGAKYFVSARSTDLKMLIRYDYSEGFCSCISKGGQKDKLCKSISGASAPYQSTGDNYFRIN